MASDTGVGGLAPRGNGGLEPGTVLILIGLCIAALGVLLLVYAIMTCASSCDDTTDEGKICVCILGPYIIMIVVGTAIAVVGYSRRRRHRKGTPRDVAWDAD